MISTFRHFLGTWPARVFFLLLVGVFVIWGVGDVIRNAGVDTSVATVAGHKIELPDASDAYRRQLAQVTRMLGTSIEPTPEIRRSVAAQSLEALITRTAVSAAVAVMGVVVPDEALRQATFGMAAFKGPGGAFDKGVFLSVLRSNGYTEQHFLDLLRIDMAQRQLISALRAGTASPDVLTRQVFAFQQEKRVADALSFPFAAAAAPPAPTDAELTRWYENHKDQYSTPERRRIKAIVLSPETVARDVQITEDDLKAAYEQRKADFMQPEKRTIQVVLLQDEAKAKALAEAWQAGADWAKVEALAKQDGGAPVELDNAVETEIPAPELAKAAFGAAVNTVLPPVKSALGWHVLKVTAITPAADKTLDQVRPELRAQVLADKAADIIYDRANKIDDMLSAGTRLDALPGDLGVAAVSGTLDAQGMAADGKPAPIPGDDQLRAALIQTAFKMKQGDPAHLIEAPREANAAQSFYAVEVDDIQPPAPRPFAEVKPAVQADWTHDAVRHTQEEAAARALTAIKQGQTAAAAAAIAGVTVQRLPPVGRAAPADGVPTQLIDPLFSLKQGEPTMVETPDGFTVAVLAEIQRADPNADPIGFGQVRDALGRAIADDIQAAATVAMRDRGDPRINRAVADRIAQGE